MLCSFGGLGDPAQPRRTPISTQSSSRTALARGFARRFVLGKRSVGARDLYRGILGREPQSSECRALDAQLVLRGNLEEVVREMVRSREFEIMVAPQVMASASVDWCGAYLGFVHIPKTAGTSTRLALIEAAGVPAIELYGRRGSVPRDQVRKLSFWPLFAGHASVEFFPDSHDLLTVFREPRARLLSSYRQRQRDLGVVHLQDAEAMARKWENVRRARTTPFVKWMEKRSYQLQADYLVGRSVDYNSDHRHSAPAALDYSTSALDQGLQRLLGAGWGHDPGSIESMIEHATSRKVSLPKVNVFEPGANHSEDSIDRTALSALDRAVEPDRVLLAQAASRGLIEPLSSSEADAIFEETAQRLQFRLT